MNNLEKKKITDTRTKNKQDNRDLKDGATYVLFKHALLR